MQNLSDNWFIEPVFDFEYKTYQVLGYSKTLSRHFSDWRFYPYIDDLSRHYQQLLDYVQTKDEMEEKLRKVISEFDFENFKILKEPIADPQGIISELESILAFALHRFSIDLKNAQTELNLAEKELEIRQLGLSDLTLNQGLLLFRQPTQTRIYTYQMRMVRRPGTHRAHKDLKTQFVQTLSTGMFTDFSEVKWSVIKRQSLDKSSNAFLVETNKELPHYELVLPVVKNFVLGLMP